MATFVFIWLTASGRTGVKNNFTLTQNERSWLKNHADEVVFAPTPYYPPLDFFDPEGEHQGLAGDVFRLIEEKIGFKFKRKEFSSWSEIVQAAKKRKIDGVPLVHKTEERTKYWNFTESYIEIPSVIIGREDAKSISSLDKFTGKELAVGEDYAVLVRLKRDHPQLDITEVSSDLEGLQRLSLGEFDGMLIDFPVASHLIEQAEIPNLKIIGQSKYTYQYRLAVRKDWPILVRILDKALADIADKKLEELKNKWIPGLSPAEESYPWKIILTVLGLLVLALVFFGFWVWLLRRTVEKRTDQLKESKRRLSTLINNIPGGIVYRCQNEPDWPMEIIRGDCRQITGYSALEIKNGDVSWGKDIIHPEDKTEVQKQIQSALENKTQFSVQHRIKTREDETRWLTDRGQGIYDRDGKLEAIEGFITDITHQKEIEEQLNESLEEKETLLHEIHHRVKNNLFTIISFLSLQKNKYSGEMSQCLQEAINRVQTMALIHKEIYENSDLANLNFASLIKTISKNLIDTYRQPDQEIKCDYELEEINLTPRRAIPCSLAATELISNSIYHGIEEQQEGNIKIKLEKIKKEKARLSITDNGRGLPEDFDIETDASMGLSIARKLVENQLNGELKIVSTSRSKTSSYIIFPLTE
ncbi:MAG: transporter substrate-binding domain-containing protein [bacterium]